MRIFAATAVFALLLVGAGPAHAAFLSYLDANVDLNFGATGELTGNIVLTLNNPIEAAHLGPYHFSGDLTARV